MSDERINLKLKVWRQKGPEYPGGLVDYDLDGVNPHMSFLEMIDVLNNKLVKEGEEPIVFDHDCREGICGMCSMTINGNPHGPQQGTTTCQLHMRHFKDGETITIEPFRANAFPVVRDLMVDRSSFDKVIQAGGYISVSTGNAPDAHSIPVEKEKADKAFNYAACIGCGACVAACKNSSAMLFVGAKFSQFEMLPQGQVESDDRVLAMVDTMDEAGFGSCSNTKACSASCPKEISIEAIATMNRAYLRASLKK